MKYFPWKCFMLVLKHLKDDVTKKKKKKKKTKNNNCSIKTSKTKKKKADLKRDLFLVLL